MITYILNFLEFLFVCLSLCRSDGVFAIYSVPVYIPLLSQVWLLAGFLSYSQLYILVIYSRGYVLNLG